MTLERARELLDVEEARTELYEARLGRAAFYEAIRRGEVPSIRLGRRILIPRRAAERHIAGELPAVGHPSDTR